MSDLVVIPFGNETDGRAALAAIRGAQKGAGLALKDSTGLADADARGQPAC